MSSSPVCIAVYSAEGLVYGRKLTCARCGFGLPEYFGFGTSESVPFGLKAFSRHAPSTTLQIGLVTYVAACCACEVREFAPAVPPPRPPAPLPAPPPPLPGDAPRDVTSQAAGIGVICDSSLYVYHRLEYP